jgi:hypothetical protein
MRSYQCACVKVVTGAAANCCLGASAEPNAFGANSALGASGGGSCGGEGPCGEDAFTGPRCGVTG